LFIKITTAKERLGTDYTVLFCSVLFCSVNRKSEKKEKRKVKTSGE